MSGTLLHIFPGPDRNDFGGCPRCHRNNGCLNTRAGKHYFICRRHGLSWLFGTDQSPAWHEMGPESLRRQEAELRRYREVPTWYPPIVCERWSMDKPDRPMRRWMNHNPETIQLRSARATETDDPLFVRLRNGFAIRREVVLDRPVDTPAQQVDLNKGGEPFRPSFTTFDGNARWREQQEAKEKGDD